MNNLKQAQELKEYLKEHKGKYMESFNNVEWGLEQTKTLLKGVENGCGIRWTFTKDNKGTVHCGKEWLCPDCKESFKIREEILK